MKLDHLAIGVSNIQSALSIYKDLLKLEFIKIEIIENQNVKVAILNISGIKIELLEPINTNSPIYKFVQNSMSKLHHICFEVDDIKAVINNLLEKGAIIIDHKPRQGAHDTKVAFIHPKSSNNVLIELSEIPNKS